MIVVGGDQPADDDGVAVLHGNGRLGGSLVDYHGIDVLADLHAGRRQRTYLRGDFELDESVRIDSRRDVQEDPDLFVLDGVEYGAGIGDAAVGDERDAIADAYAGRLIVGGEYLRTAEDFDSALAL